MIHNGRDYESLFLKPVDELNTLPLTWRQPVSDLMAKYLIFVEYEKDQTEGVSTEY